MVKCRKVSGTLHFFVQFVSSMSRLYVGNLPSEAREDDLRRLFSTKAEVRDVTMKNGFAFIVRGG